eukprot:2149273-Rhodomonas_salina.2
MNDYQILQDIGKSKSSLVYKGRKKKTIEFYALKCVDKSQKQKVVPRHPPLTPEQRNPSRLSTATRSLHAFPLKLSNAANSSIRAAHNQSVLNRSCGKCASCIASRRAAAATPSSSSSGSRPPTTSGLSSSCVQVASDFRPTHALCDVQH